MDVYRDAAGAVAVLALRPDISEFTHAPHTYFGPDGTRLLVVPERPITPEERRTDPVLRKQDELLAKLVKGDSERCEGFR